MSDFCSADNPYNPTARMARDAERSQRRSAIARDPEIDPELAESRREPRDWTPRLPKSNYPRELTDLATEVDVMIRYHVRTRQKVRQYLVGARLANARQGITVWERDQLDRENAEALAERVEVRQVIKRQRDCSGN